MIFSSHYSNPLFRLSGSNFTGVFRAIQYGTFTVALINNTPLKLGAIPLPLPDPAYRFIANVLWRNSPLPTPDVFAVTVDRVVET